MHNGHQPQPSRPAVAPFIPVQRPEDVETLLPSSVDILHLWGTPGKEPSKPWLVTIEGNGRPGEVFHPNTVFVSRKHAENHGSSHFVFLAKASWSVKNLEGAIAIARKAGLPLEVLRSRDWPFELHKILPRIKGIRYHGMVADPEKREILSRARALIFAVRWHEPFGIAITEALASGCAVFGTPYGSLPEIVTSDVGTLSTDGNVLVRAIHSHRPTPEQCRKRVYQGFTYHDMARAYLGYYTEVLKTGRLSPAFSATPRTVDGFVSQELLPWITPNRYVSPHSDGSANHSL